jgi:ATP-binding cassette subfamily C exporter for protease/lipase
MAFSEWIRSRLLVRAGVRFDEQLNTRIFHASFQANIEKPDSNSLSTFSDLTRLRQFLSGIGIIALLDFPWTAIYLSILFIMHPLLGWFGIIFTFILSLLSFFYSKLITKPIEESVSAESKTMSFLTGKLRNAEVIEAMGMLGNIRRRWLILYAEHVKKIWISQIQSGKASALLKFIQYSQQSIILSLGAWLVINDEISPGAMIASNMLMSNALRPIGVLGSTLKEFIQARKSYQDINKLLIEYPKQKKIHNAEIIAGQIALLNFSAFAKSRERPILDGINANFSSGKITGVLGPSGSGKSTLVKSILGIWPQTSGQVMFDGVDIKEWSRESLGPHLGYLPQEIDLLDGTVAENICRFNSIDSNAIVEAAKKTDIHNLILRLPNGYDTHIGQAGKLISAGQRQRLGLARAIYGSPKLLILDEPDANLDDIGEIALINVIQNLKKNNSTVFIISHQKNLLALADEIIVMNNGKIIQILNAEHYKSFARINHSESIVQ